MGITLKNNKSITKNMTIKGDNGVGIKTITSGTPVVTEEKTTTPITVTLTDETTQNFNVEAQNGSGADNALTKPTTAPSTTQIVAVDNTNSQKMLTIGDGLSIENDNMKIKLFKHHLLIRGYSKLFAYMTLINTSNEIITNDILFDILPLNTDISATGYVTDSASVIHCITKYNTGINFTYIKFAITDNNLTNIITDTTVSISNVTVFDDVEEC